MSIETESEDPKAQLPVPSNPPEKLDFAKYRSDELGDSLAELISVPGRIITIVRMAALVIALTAICCYLVRVFAELSLIPSLLVCAYSLVMAVYFGVSLGILRVISKALQNIESILQIVLDTTVQVAQDYEQTRTGRMQLPSGGELVEQVYAIVIVPALERAVAKSFRFLSRPILWLHRRTIGAAVHKLVIRVNRSLCTTEEEPQTAVGVAANSEQFKTWFAGVVTFTATASRIAANLGRRLRTYAMLPLYLMFGISVAIAAIPVVAVVYFLGG